jgi:thiol-disulfide isomerase/thioredoxin
MGCAQIRFYDAAAAAALALALFLVSGAAANETPQACSSKPIVVKIHAAWCATCKSLDATWEQIRSDLGDQATVVELDVTDRLAYQQSQAEAERLGISDFFRKYRSKTGAIAILDCNTHEPVLVLRGERDLTKYQEAVAKAGHAL